MSWSWSHSVEGLEAARANVFKLPKETLQDIWAEWAAYEPAWSGGKSHERFNTKRYDKRLQQAKQLSADTLAETIWVKMEELRTCTNGGHLAYCCPFGCHMVSFTESEVQS